MPVQGKNNVFIYLIHVTIYVKHSTCACTIKMAETLMNIFPMYHIISLKYLLICTDYKSILFEHTHTQCQQLSYC